MKLVLVVSVFAVLTQCTNAAEQDDSCANKTLLNNGIKPQLKDIKRASAALVAVYIKHGFQSNHGTVQTKKKLRLILKKGDLKAVKLLAVSTMEQNKSRTLYVAFDGKHVLAAMARYTFSFTIYTGRQTTWKCLSWSLAVGGNGGSDYFSVINTIINWEMTNLRDRIEIKVVPYTEDVPTSPVSNDNMDIMKSTPKNGTKKAVQATNRARANVVNRVVFLKMMSSVGLIYVAIAYVFR